MTNEKIFIKAILAGIFIGIAGLIYLSVDNKTIGAILFSFGLLMVVSKGYFLYTGKVGYLIPYTKGYLLVLLKTLLGNIIGIATVGLLFRFTGISPIIDAAQYVALLKLDRTWYQTLILAIFCGMMMYVGVQGYKTMTIDLLKVLIVIFAVTIFILAKFEHSIANLLYLFVGNVWSLKTLLYIGIWVIGNGIGSIFLNILEVELSKS